MASNDPFVSIVTPVYNGERYLEECIKSVLAQAYQNWEYVIVNNCSTDKTLEIAQSYADKDKRIKVVTNQTFVGLIKNHNIAFQQISEKSDYCKVISADDWLYPHCLSKMVGLAKANPSVGIVGSYQLSGDEIRWKGLPVDVEVISGREVCRLSILDDLNVFGGTTSSLYRSDLVRSNTPFFPHELPYADTSAVYKYLENTDYGFVQEALSYERVHQGQVSYKEPQLGIGRIKELEKLLQYGPIYLSENEFEIQKNEALKNYWRGLGGYLLNLYSMDFWKFQSSRLKELGYPLPWSKVLKGAVDEILEEMQNPKVAFNKVLAIIKSRF